jgi:hypothetical protein
MLLSVVLHSREKVQKEELFKATKLWDFRSVKKKGIRNGYSKWVQNHNTLRIALTPVAASPCTESKLVISLGVFC